MAKNYRNTMACDIVAVAISAIRRTGVAEIRDEKAMLRAYHALLNEPPPCAEDCKWANGARRQKCNCCARNYKNMNDLYERK